MKSWKFFPNFAAQKSQQRLFGEVPGNDRVAKAGAVRFPRLFNRRPSSWTSGRELVPVIEGRSMTAPSVLLLLQVRPDCNDCLRCRLHQAIISRMKVAVALPSNAKGRSAACTGRKPSSSEMVSASNSVLRSIQLVSVFLP
jgi:hypothetical protein